MKNKLSVIHALAFSMVMSLLPSVSAAAALEFQGVVEFRSKVEISALLDGVVTAVHVETGDVVRQGDLLVEFDSRGIEAGIEIEKSGVTRSRVIEKQVDDEHFRLHEMYDRGSLSQYDLDRSQEAVAIASADRAEAEANLELARLELEKTRLTAPFDAVVDSMGEISVGASYRTTDSDRALIHLAKLGEFVVRTTVSLDERVMLTSGQGATVHIGDRTISAAVKFESLSPVYMDGSSTARYEISIVFDANNEQVLPGRIVEVTIESPSYRMVICSAPVHENISLDCPAK